MMKSRFNLCCACAIAMLLLANAASATILTDDYDDDDDYGGGGSGFGTPTSSSASAYATPSDTYCWGFGEGERFIYTTVSGTFGFGGTVSAYASAEMTSCIFGGYAYAAASGVVSFPSGYRNLEFDIGAYDDAGIPDASVYPEQSRDFTRYFAAQEGFSSSCSAVAVASVSDMGWDEASAGATANASPRMY